MTAIINDYWSSGPIPEDQIAIVIGSLAEIEDFLNMEVRFEGKIDASHWRTKAALALNDYLRQTQREPCRQIPELLPAAQEIVDMVNVCKEKLATNQPLSAEHIEPYSTHFTALGVVITQHFQAETGPKY